MSQYDRRTWQRPKGERTLDPLWEEDVVQATGHQAQRATVSHTDRRHKSSIAGNRKQRALRGLLSPQYRMED